MHNVGEAKMGALVGKGILACSPAASSQGAGGQEDRGLDLGTRMRLWAEGAPGADLPELAVAQGALGRLGGGAAARHVEAVADSHSSVKREDEAS